MKIVAILDPSVGTENVGDEIIYDSVRQEVDALFDEPFVIRISSHEFMLWESRKVLKKASHVFLGGSNLLESRMEWNIQWKLSPFDVLKRLNAICLGCGWKHYSRDPSPYTKLLYSRALSDRYFHSVRDDLTRAQLGKVGLGKVLNTSCVTMWNLSPEHCAGIPRGKAETVITTVTEYHADVENDRFMMAALFANYEKVWLFVQQPEDLKYAQSIAPGEFAGIVFSLKRYDELLSSECDYVGTRLHGGIRALQKGRRTLIIGIDNRAIEIARDTNLPTIVRTELRDKLVPMIQGPFSNDLKLPVDAIARWRGQFEADAVV